MELANRVEQEICKPFHKQSKSLLFDLYREAFGSLNGLSMGCSSCKHDAFIMLNAWLKNNNTELFKSKLNLFTSRYKDKSIIRQRELDFCLEQNRSSGIFDNVIVIENTRPTFKDFFELTKQYPDHVNVIANSDMLFTQSILQAKAIRPNEAYALSRWDYTKGGTIKHYNQLDSQDVWIFRGASRCDAGEFNMGIPGCDNRIAYELKMAGYKVTNPSKRIKTVHLHLSNVKNYNNKTPLVPKPYLMVQPCH